MRAADPIKQFSPAQRITGSTAGEVFSLKEIQDRYKHGKRACGHFLTTERARSSAPGSVSPLQLPESGPGLRVELSSDCPAHDRTELDLRRVQDRDGFGEAIRIPLPDQPFRSSSSAIILEMIFSSCLFAGFSIVLHLEAKSVLLFSMQELKVPCRRMPLSALDQARANPFP